MRPRQLLVLMLLAGLPVIGRCVTNVFEYPLVYRQHLALTQQMQQALRQHDAAEMERVCRAGVALLPENAVWRYNLACALAKLGKNDAALETLEKAVELGYRDVEAMRRDDDLASLRRLFGFNAVLTRAQNLGNTPVPGQPVVTAAPVSNGVAWVSASNTLWDFDLGHFRAFFALPTNAVPGAAALAEAWTGNVAPEVRGWLAAGTAAGNAGDFYDNRDAGHSPLDTRAFPGLTTIRYAPDARQAGVHGGLACFLYNGVVIGNSSMAITSGPYWRSVPREAMCDGLASVFLFVQYLNHHLYCYPSHRDYDAVGLGDLYPANQPYMLISHGSSWSDQALVKAVTATLAAFTPETKRFLIAHGLLMPTVQMILRASQKSVQRPEDYLSGAAHPAVFEAANLDVERMVRMAHALATNDVPPLVTLKTLEEQVGTAGVDFFDLANSDAQYDTPCAVSRVMRSMSFRHTMKMQAALSGTHPDGWRLQWVLLRGDSRKVVLLPLKADQSQMNLSVAYHGARFPEFPGSPLLTSRVDVGVFATRGPLASAPAFVSCLFLGNERRTYADDGRILAVDYASATNVYVDPVLSLPKQWRDEYTHDENGQPTGWTRLRGGQSERFTMRGERVEQTDARGRAVVTRTVTYLPRQVSTGVSAPDLVQVDGEFRMTYRYVSDDDTTGTLLSRERVAP